MATQEANDPFDAERTVAPLEARMLREANQRHRELLAQVIEHIRSEIQGELASLLATLVDEPRYHHWGLPTETGPKGREAVRAFYQQLISEGGNRFHLAIERIVVDEDCVVTEGSLLRAVPGAWVAAAGVAEVDGEPIDPAATYLAECRILTLWPADVDGRLRGEDVYLGSPLWSRLRRL